MLKLFSFDASTLEEHRRLAAWSEVLAGFKAKSVGDASPQSFSASLSGLKAPWGFVMARLEMSAQHISVETRAFSGSIWLARIAEGAGTLRTERGSMPFETGDMIVGKMPRELRLTATTKTSIDYVQFTGFQNSFRLASLATPSIALRLAGDVGSTTFLADLVKLATARAGTMTADEIRPLEITLVEFLMASIATTGASSNVIDGSRTRNAIALRATQAIELKLSDPDLTPSGIADHLGISLRYLQKLFEDVGENANHYIRRRRLERSHQDLADPLYSGLSIAEISYRWGFNDSAYFSRAFKDRFGMSPSQHRDHWRSQELTWSKARPDMRARQPSDLRIAR
ncbi:helix-turn-helix domain-containing protein [Neorhizobium sp. DAR64861/K0K2]|uniref:helix-turn-helix domain-containing protein n=1 Tax=unclassified Neorhizobium TaxID=2629175 RepID=UPI003D2C7024